VSRNWIRITECENIPLREGRVVRIGDQEIAVFNLGDRFFAVENRCPHRGGPLADGIVSGNTVVCPLHAWKFNLETGAGVSATSQGSCVRAFPTRVQDGIVQLELPAEFAGGIEVAPICAEFGADRPWSWSPSVRIVDEL
jgi:nitrite reductase (NADH) small subunit